MTRNKMTLEHRASFSLVAGMFFTSAKISQSPLWSADMPVMVRKKGSKKYTVREPGGKVRGTHSTRKAAKAQQTAINISKAKKRK